MPQAQDPCPTSAANITPLPAFPHCHISLSLQDPKYGPLSQQILTHEAFRASGERLKAAAAALEAGNGGAVNAAALADFALQVQGGGAWAGGVGERRGVQGCSVRAGLAHSCTAGKRRHLPSRWRGASWACDL